jgi:predicted metal-dependent hydrolase
MQFLFGPGGLVTDTLPAWRAYKRAAFHPQQQDSQPAADWLAAHGDQYQAVARSAA